MGKIISIFEDTMGNSIVVVFFNSPVFLNFLSCTLSHGEFPCINL